MAGVEDDLVAINAEMRARGVEEFAAFLDGEGAEADVRANWLAEFAVDLDATLARQTMPSPLVRLAEPLQGLQ